MKVLRVLRYWQQMINCRNPRCRYGCRANPAIKPHGPYYYGNVQDGAGRVRNVYIGANPQAWLDELNDEQDNDDPLELPTISAGAPENRLHPNGNKTKAAKTTKAKTQRSRNKTTAPKLSRADAIAKAFLDRRPTPKDALSYLSASRDAKTIKAAIRRMAMVAHPDKGGTVLQMQAVNAAKDLLKPWT